MISTRPLYRTTSDDPIAQLHRYFLQVLSVITIGIATLNFVTRVVIFKQADVYDVIGNAALVIGGLAALIFIYRNRTEAGNYALLLAQAAVLLLVTTPGNILAMATLLLLCSALTPPLVFVAVNFAVFARLLKSALDIIAVTGLQFTPDMVLIITMAISLLVIGFTTRLFINATQQAAEQSISTAKLLRATAEIGQATSNLLKMEDLFNHAVELIRDRFAFYHVQIFVVDDERKFARLVASTGETGQKLLERGHKLAVGSQSVIGRVTQIGEAVIARDTDNDPIHTVNELLPNTKSELALPIVDGERIIGALDVQSLVREKFTQHDIQAMQVMANQLATAIRNAKLFEQQEVNVQMNQRLLLEARTNLREIQRLNSQLSKKAWDEYLSEKREHAGIVFTQDSFQTQVQWTPEMMEATTNQRPVNHVGDNNQVTAVPIMLRGEVIGAIEVEAGEVRGNDLVEMMQAVAQNLAVSLDSARLFEEAQEAAAQEQRINTIVERYQSAATVDELLKITVSELGQALGSEQSVIRLGIVSNDTGGEQHG